MRVITFSRNFPSYHPKVGQPTYFVEKIWESLINLELISLSKCCELSRETGIGELNMNNIRKINYTPKFHTIRAGNRWKVGDKFSPRVWSGKPYRSPQIIIAPDIEIKKIWDIKIVGSNIYINKAQLMGYKTHEPYVELAKNDGLEINDFWDWFPYKHAEPFSGQIICWNENIKY